MIIFAYMVGYKHISQTITGKKAEEILKAIPQKDCSHRELAKLPDKFTVSISPKNV